MKNFDFKSLPAKILPVLQSLRKYSPLMFIVALVSIYGFLVFRVNSLTSSELNEDAITEKLQTVKRPKIDQSAVEKLEQLEDSNIEVKTLFQHARENPFQE